MFIGHLAQEVTVSVVVPAGPSDGSSPGGALPHTGAGIVLFLVLLAVLLITAGRLVMRIEKRKAKVKA